MDTSEDTNHVIQDAVRYLGEDGKFDRVRYQREYMRKVRARKKEEKERI